ncbi:ABC transporter permease subunit [bacterium]|nr:ABC transporter permease subunit [bacterium]
MTAFAVMRVIARRQFQEAALAPRGTFLAIFWALLVLLAVWSGTLAASSAVESHQASASVARDAYERWVGLYPEGDWRPVYMAVENPLLLQKPPAPARALSGGIDDLAGSWAIPTGFHLRELDGRKADLSPLGTLLGGLDLAGLVALVGALAALALGFDAVSGERERGTLALHFANPIGRGTFIFGKALGTLGALGLVLGLPLLMGLGALLALGAIASTPENLARVGAFFFASLLYLALWSLLAVAVSASVRRSATSFVVLAGVWLLLAIALPKVALATANRMHPLPAPVALEQKLSKALDASKDYYRAEFGKWKDAHGGQRPDAKATAELKLSYYAFHRKQLDAIVADYEGTLSRWNGTFALGARLSPSYAYQELASVLAGTDPERHRTVLAAFNRYLWDLKLQAEQRIIDGQDGPPAYAELPRLRFEEPRFAERVTPVAQALGGFLLEALFIAALALLAFRRYPLKAQTGS